MAIERIERNGVWIEKADNPKDAALLHEKHGPDLQKRGVDDFDKKYKKDLSEGFERVTDPGGHVTLVRRDRMEAALAQGYGRAPTRGATFVLPEMPWHADRTPKWGRTVYKYDKGTDSIVEAT